tara:strand:+ start:229 stop:540 length:312 start_codon:yes stop_codon:yes gene_type:complete
MNGHSDVVGMQEAYHDFVDTLHECKNQEQEVLEFMKFRGSITQKEANIQLSVGRLASRIHNLIHRDGYVIDKKMITVENQFGKKVRVMEYSYDENKNGGNSYG